MSVNSVLGSAVSGLLASQTAMRVTSTNIANVNTPGYARAQVHTQPLVLGGMGAGVDITAIRRVADQFLQRASWRATADAAGAERAFDMLDRLQTQFGALDDPGSLFGRIEATFAPLTQLAASPSSAGDRAAAISAIQAVLDEAARLSASTQALRGEADNRIAITTGRINELLTDIASINGEIARARLAGDSTGAENTLAGMLDELASLIDIRVVARPQGGVEVRTTDGLLLTGQTAASLSYTPAVVGSFNADYAEIMVTPATGGAPKPLDPHVRSGELAGLLKLRDGELPAVALELGELTAGYADALNAAHNTASAVPAPAQMNGRNTGLLAGDALGFTGQASIGVVDGTGAMTHRIDIDFGAQTISVDGGGPVAFGPGATVGGFVTALNAQMGPLGGSATFANGRLTLTAGAGEGLAIQQPDPGGAARGGRGFSHFFGLNDVVTSSSPAFFDTGLTGAEAHGFTAGQELEFRITGGQAGAFDITIAIGGATINDVLAQLNNPVTGVGGYMTFSIGANGALVSTPVAGQEHMRVELIGDTTTRGGTGLGFSQLFGLGPAARAGRASAFSVRADIAANPMNFAAAAPDIRAAALGDFVLGTGDGRGALALHAALTGPRNFSTAGAIAATAMGVTDYAARLAGDIGGRAARAERLNDSAAALKTTANEQRSSLEGVNLDEELANMTIYQQSYNASSRLLQAAKEMMDTLLSVI